MVNSPTKSFYLFSLISLIIVISDCAAKSKPTTASPASSVVTERTTTTTAKTRPLPPRLKNIKLLSSELRTGLNIDVSTHPKFNLLPNVSECGFSGKFSENGTDASGAGATSTTASSVSSNRNKRLVGGNYPSLGTFPWAARIDLIDGDSGNSTLRCGASLINSRYILTSARCLTSIPATQTLKHIGLGTTDRRIKFQCVSGNETNCVNSTMVEIEDIIVHEDFVKSSAWNDIALIRMSEEVQFSQFVRPVCLPTNENVLDDWKNNKLTVYGWGRQESDDEVEPFFYSWNLQSLNISLARREQCDRVYRRMTGKLTASRFCAGGEAEKGTCRADTGGAVLKKITVPLPDPDSTDDDSTSTEETTERYYQFGIIHFGRCALEGIPSVYINVLYYMKWILDNIEP